MHRLSKQASAMMVPVMLGLGMAPIHAAAKQKAARAPQLQRVVDCKGIADPAARLACYDREVTALDTAERSNDLVVVEKEKVREAQRSAFGLTLPQVDALAGDDAKVEIRQIEGKVASARQAFDGWRIVLADGSVWQQTDDKPLFRDPAQGQDVVVSRGSFGSFFMRIGTMPGIRVRRIA